MLSMRPPSSMRKPFSMITAGQGTGLVEILAIEEKKRISRSRHHGKAGDRVLLDYFAIADQGARTWRIRSV